MFLKKLFDKIFKPNNKAQEPPSENTREKVALHEAAHGVVWYLFRDNWIVNRLTIERDSLPSEDMNGALSISANFDINKQSNIARANELFAIALAGMVGQNIQLIIQKPYIMIEIANAVHFNQILNTNGCSGDFEIASKYLPHLGKEFQVNEGDFTKYKVMDLVNMFQGHRRVQEIHLLLTQLLLDKGTIPRDELITFFEENDFAAYIKNEDLDISFFHQG